jgi:putative tryptophan/tyrosine transport system substrate-binding protein
MRRRDFIGIVGGGAAALPFAAQAQKSALPVVGYLSAGTSSSDARPVAAFVKGLGETGYEDGKTVKIDYRWADNQYDRLPLIAADLVRQQVAVIAAVTTPAARAAKAATATIPVVFTTIADPVEIGFVASLNRPGGNVTGVTLLAVEIGPKLLQLLHAAVPSASIIALLLNPTNPNAESQSKSIQEAAVKLGLQIHVLNASAERDFEAAFAKLRELGANALVIGQDVFFNANKRATRSAHGPPRGARNLSAVGIRCGWRFDQLRCQPERCLASSGNLRRANPERRETCRTAGSPANQVRIDDQSQDGQGARSRCTLGSSQCSRRSD